jgi:hypothetical protein
MRWKASAAAAVSENPRLLAWAQELREPAPERPMTTDELGRANAGTCQHETSAGCSASASASAPHFAISAYVLRKQMNNVQ